MILYSIIPAETVFQGSCGQEEVKYIEAGYRGERVVVAQTADRRYTIAKLLSTRPGSFLNSDFQPGNVVDAGELEIEK
jgi:hypothetical protein